MTSLHTISGYGKHKKPPIRKIIIIYSDMRLSQIRSRLLTNSKVNTSHPTSDNHITWKLLLKWSGGYMYKTTWSRTNCMGMHWHFHVIIMSSNNVHQHTLYVIGFVKRDHKLLVFDSLRNISIADFVPIMTFYVLYLKKSL